ncbi:MAG: hypothetical protein ACYDD0_04330 [Candidatus Dormibacteria bacterium]
MLSLTELAFLAPTIPAAAALASGVMGRPWLAGGAAVARWLVRGGLLLALTDVAVLLYLIQPAGTVQVTLWEFDSRLPVTVQVDVGGAAIALAVLAAALVVSFSASERRPLASAALALAALGGVMVALSGGLLGLFVGLELSAAGGIGLSYARYPRAASSRIVWAAAADQVVALIWLGALIVIYRQVGTLQFADIPTSVVGFTMAGILLVPALVRLAGAALLVPDPRERSQPGAARALDVADWMAVVAVPTALVVILRVRQLAGGSWPTPAFGTLLDLIGLAFGGAALGFLLLSPAGQSEVRALLLGTSGLVWFGFGSNAAAGVQLALGAGIFLELAVALLPRALFGSRVQSGRARPLATAQRLAGVGAALAPVSLAGTVAMLGLSAALQTGGSRGVLPALGYALVLAVLGLVAARGLRPRGGPRPWDWALCLPAVGLLGAAVLPGWVLTTLAGPIAFAGSAGTTGLTAPDPLVVQIGSTVWPAGYLAILLALGGFAFLALRFAVGLPVWPPRASAPAEQSPATTSWRVAFPAPIATGWSYLLRGSDRLRSAGSLVVELAERDLAERPVWLWLATISVVGWLMAQR